MEYIYSALLLHDVGKEVTEENVKNILTAAGVEADEGRIKALIAALEEVNIDEVLQNAAAAPVAMAPVAGAAESNEEKKEENKEDEKKDEASEEEAVAGLGALFG